MTSKKGDIGTLLMCLKKDYQAKGTNTGKNIQKTGENWNLARA